MISNSDLEKTWFLYKTEYEPQNVCPVRWYGNGVSIR